MRAAIISEHGASPFVGEFPDPKPQDREVLIDVETAGLGGWDVLGAYRLGVKYPCVVRGEGVGRAPDGRRVYFGERSTPPFGAWAERTVVSSEEVWDVPDEVDDRTAIVMAIAGTGAYVPLQTTHIQQGETVLVIGATGAVGQLGLQFARVMGAGRVIAASRNQVALDRLKKRGVADAVVRVGAGDDLAAFKSEAGEGYDVVLDLVCGSPMLAAMKATRWGARIVTAGVGAGAQVSFSMGDLLFRTLSVVGTGQRPAVDRENMWRHLLKLATEHRITVDHMEFDVKQIAEAWTLQRAGPHAKITAAIKF